MVSVAPRNNLRVSPRGARGWLSLLSDAVDLVCGPWCYGGYYSGWGSILALVREGADQHAECSLFSVWGGSGRHGSLSWRDLRRLWREVAGRRGHLQLVAGFGFLGASCRWGGVWGVGRSLAEGFSLGTRILGCALLRGSQLVSSSCGCLAW